MKTKLTSFALAGIMSVQAISFAQPSRVDGIGDMQILAAINEMMILRHDILRLDQALVETAEAIKKRQENGELASAVSISGAALGLGLAALSMTVSRVGGDSGAGTLLSMAGFGIVAIKTSTSAALRLVSELQKGRGETNESKNALTKARQEILAAQAGSELDPQSLETLNELDRSLEVIEESLDSYQRRQNLQQTVHFTSLLTQATGAALTFYVAAQISNGRGMNKGTAALGPILMTVGNISSIASLLVPSKTDAILAEIAKTRLALAQALMDLQE